MNRKRMKTALFIIVVISILSYLNITLMAESKKRTKRQNQLHRRRRAIQH